MKKLIILMSPACNLRCKYCYVYNEPTYLEKNNYKNASKSILPIIEFLTQHQETSLIQLMGGEPTVQLDLLEFICSSVRSMPQYKSNMHYPRIGIISNGVWLNQKRTLSIIKRFNLDITISLDGEQCIHDELRVTDKGDGTYSEVVKSMQLLRNEEIPYSVESVITSLHLESLNSISTLMDLCSNYGAKKLFFDPAYPPAPDYLIPLCKEHLQKLIFIYKKSFDYWYKKTVCEEKRFLDCLYSQITLYLIEGKTMFTELSCGAGNDIACIDSQGIKHDCNLFIGYESKIKNLYIPRMYSDIEKCSECVFRFWCKVCPAVNVRLGKINEVPECECVLKKELISYIAKRLFSDNLLTLNNFTRPLLNYFG